MAEYNFSKLLPDGSFIIQNTLFIIEVKCQQGEGPLDEKLQTCDCKRKQHLKLVVSLELKVGYFYVWIDWLKTENIKTLWIIFTA